MMKSYQEACEKLDWKLVQKQKDMLLEMLITLKAEDNILWGLVNFIDDLQDVNEADGN